MLRTFVFFMAMWAAGCSVHAAGIQFIEVIYSGLRLKIPASPLIIGYLGGNAESLVVKYSESPGSGYIGFTNDHDLYTGSCAPEVFLEKVVSNPDADDCDGAVKAFQNVFLKTGDYGIWAGSGNKFYYFMNNEEPSFLFWVSDEGTVIKMESDFLEKSDFERALSSYL